MRSFTKIFNRLQQKIQAWRPSKRSLKIGGLAAEAPNWRRAARGQQRMKVSRHLSTKIDPNESKVYLKPIRSITTNRGRR